MVAGIVQCWESNRLAVEEVWRSPHSKITIHVGVSLAQSLEKERWALHSCVYIHDRILYFTCRALFNDYIESNNGESIQNVSNKTIQLYVLYYETNTNQAYIIFQLTCLKSKFSCRCDIKNKFV